MSARKVDVVCPSCGRQLRGSLSEALPGNPRIFVEYPHRAPSGKGWCQTGTWTADPATVATSQEALDLGGAA